MLEIKNVQKKYGNKVVLNSVSVEFGQGIYGILGENGAGKTTLFRCIADLIEDYSGEIVIPKEARMSYLPQSFGMPEELSVVEVMEYISLLRDKKSADVEQIRYLLELLNLEKQSTKRVRQLSGGMLRRLGIAQAFMGDSNIVILDEPTAGLDPEERLRFKRALGALEKERLILLSTHLLTDVEDVCEKVVVLHEGAICFRGTVEELKDMAAGKVYKVPQKQLNHMQSEYFLIRMDNCAEGNARLLSSEKLLFEEEEPTVEDGYLCVIKGI